MHAGNRGMLESSAAILFSLPIVGSEAQPKGGCVLGERKRLFSVSMRRDGWHKPIFLTPFPSYALIQLDSSEGSSYVGASSQSFHAQGVTWDQQRRKSHNCAAV